MSDLLNLLIVGMGLGLALLCGLAWLRLYRAQRALWLGFREAQALIEYGAAKEGIDLMVRVLEQDEGWLVPHAFLCASRRLRVEEAPAAVPPLSRSRTGS